MMQIRAYESLEEMTESVLELEEIPALYFKKVAINYGITSFINDYNNYCYNVSYLADNETVYSKKLWQDFIFPKFKNDDFFYYDFLMDEELNEVNKKDAGKVFIGRVVAWWEETSPIYIKLIQEYEAKVNSLLEPIKSVSKTRNNLTPQSVEVDPYDTSYTNNSSINESEQETLNNLDKLDELRSKIYNSYRDWANTFSLLKVRTN